MTNTHPNPTDSVDRTSSVAGAVALGAAAVAAFNIQPMILGALADHHGYSAEQLGSIAGLEVAGSALAGICAIFWVRRWNWRNLAVTSLLILMLGNLTSVVVVDFPLLASLRLAIGFFGMGPAYALSIAALSDTRNVERNFSIAVLVQVSVAVIGFLILPALVASHGLLAVFLPLALLAVLAIPLAIHVPKKGRASVPLVTDTKQSGRLLVWLALGCQCIWYIGLGGVWAFVERLGIEAGIDTQAVGQALAMGLVVGLLGAFAAASVANRYGRLLPFSIAMTGQVAAVILLADLHSLQGLILAVCAYNLTWNFALPYIFAAAAVADVSGRLVVLMSTAQALGLTLGAVAAGMVIGRYGLSAVLAQGGIAAIAALALFAVLAARLATLSRPA